MLYFIFYIEVLESSARLGTSHHAPPIPVEQITQHSVEPITHLPPYSVAFLLLHGTPDLPPA